MSEHNPPGTPEFRALVQPFIDKGSYPPQRELGEGEAERLSKPVQKLLVEFFDLHQAEENIAEWGTRPKKLSPWAKKRAQVRDKLRELLTADIKLLEIDLIQQSAVDKGAIPDIREENGGGKYYRTPDHYMAHWACGTNVMSKEIRGKQVPWCPTCDKEPQAPKRDTGPQYHTDGAWFR